MGLCYNAQETAMSLRILLVLLISCRSCDDAPPRGEAEDDEGAPDSEEPTTADSGDSGDSAQSFLDADGDGWDETEDCDDTDATVHPGADERCNGRDDDCDGEVDEDFVAPYCLMDSDPCPLAPELPEHIQPLVWLSFDDSDPSTNHGTLDPADWVVTSYEASVGTGAVGSGLSLVAEGSGVSGNDHIQVASAEALHPQTFTVSAWIRPDSSSDRGVVLNTIWDSGPSGLSFDYYAGFLYLRIGDGGATEAWSVAAPLGTWSHVAASFDGDVAALYVDGELRLREHKTIGDYDPGSYAFSIGAYQNTAHYPYDGTIDELRLYDRALDPAQIRHLATTAFYRFETEGTALDHGPAGLDGGSLGGLTCGPVGNAWERQADEAPLTIPAVAALDTTARLAVEAWLRPDALSGQQGIASREGSYALSLRDSLLVFQCLGHEGEAAEVSADLTEHLGLWTHVAAGFDGLHVSLAVNGERVATEHASFDRLASSEADLLLGEGLDGGLDEVSISTLPGTRAQRRIDHLRLAGYTATAITADSQGLSDHGPLALDLQGDAGTAEIDDSLRSCLYLEAAYRETCPHRQSEGSSVEAELQGPLSLHALLRPHALSGEVEIFGITDGPTLRVDDDGFALSWGEHQAEGGPSPEDRWYPVAGTVSHEGLALYVDGVLVASASFDEPLPALARFDVGSGISWTSGQGVWLEQAEVYGEAWEAQRVELLDAPWRTEDHPLLVSHAAQVEDWGESWLAGSADALTEAQSSVGDEDWSHYERAQAARLLAAAAAAASGAERDEHLEGALLLMEDLDHGYWQWGWYQGRILTWYAIAYDILAELLAEREADAPHAWSQRHTAIRRNLAAIGHQAHTVGGLDEDGYYSFGYHYHGSSWTSANARLMTTGGLGHLGLVLSQQADAQFAGGDDLLEGATDDLFEDRPGSGEAQGTYLLRYLPPSGLFCEGTGYQNDVFYTLTPFLVDWAALGGTDHLDGGRLGAMYDGNVAGMMPPGYSLLYATGWLDWINSVEFASWFSQDNAELYAWFHDRQYQWETDLEAPAWTSALIGQDAAVLRSGWETDATWLALLGKTENCYSSHAQADQMSISLVAHGAHLLIDPGDGRYYRETGDDDQETWLQSAAGHNLVLADGEGPRFSYGYDDLEDPASIVASSFGQRCDYAHMRGSIGGTAASGGVDHDRRIWLIDGSFFLLHDHLDSVTSREYAQLFHFGGPFSSGAGTLTMDPSLDLVEWSTINDQGELINLSIQQVAEPDTLAYAWYDDGGTNYYGSSTWDHVYAHVEQSGAETHYLAVLVPWTDSEAEPVFTIEQASTDTRAAWVATDAAGEVFVTLNASGALLETTVFGTDGLLGGTDTETWAFVSEGSGLWAGEALEAWAGCPLQALSLTWEAGQLMGALAREEGACSLAVFWPGGEPAGVQADGASTKSWSYDSASELLTLDPGPLESFAIW